jgi:hypothetical protein
MRARLRYATRGFLLFGILGLGLISGLLCCSSLIFPAIKFCDCAAATG